LEKKEKLEGRLPGVKAGCMVKKDSLMFIDKSRGWDKVLFLILIISL